MKKLIIVAGDAGTGKTYLSKQLARELKCTLLNKDTIVNDFTNDAAFTGPMTKPLKGWHMPTLEIKATGRGQYQRTKPDKYGFQTGDHVQSPKGHRRIAIRKTGHFALKTNSQTTTIKHALCRLTQRSDGYQYSLSHVASHAVSEKY